MKSASAARPGCHVGAEDRKVTIRLKPPYSPTYLYIVGQRRNGAGASIYRPASGEEKNQKALESNSEK